MNRLIKHLALVSIFPLLLSYGCNFNWDDEECVSDLAVTALNATNGVINGNTVEVICSLRSLLGVIGDCSDPSEGVKVTVSCRYSPVFRENFNEYEFLDETTQEINPWGNNGGQDDSMQMPTNRGTGWYAMKVEIHNDNDKNYGNNTKAVSVFVQ